MTSPTSVSIKSEHLTVDAIDHRYYLVNKRDEKLAALTRIFEIEDITSAIIFVKTRVGTGDLVNELMARGFPAEALNGDLNQQTREQVLNRFRRNQITILVATDVAARGLDIDDISHIFNYDLPDDPELYVHRVGRTARAGKKGIAISLLTGHEKWQLRQIERFTKQEITRIPVPTAAEIEKHRATKLLEQLLDRLKHGDYEKELQIVNRLGEMGHDPIQVAATALKIARGQDINRPIAPISEVNEGRKPKPAPQIRRSKQEHSGRSRGSTTSHEQGMVRMTIDAGKVHGVTPADVVGTIARYADFPGSTIGAIRIYEKHTTVDVPHQYVAQTLSKAGNCRIRKNHVTVQIA
jgi:ATP-dependent RNA helicase DeaD